MINLQQQKNHQKFSKKRRFTELKIFGQNEHSEDVALGAEKFINKRLNKEINLIQWSFNKQLFMINLDF